jgi:hypothetical protein
MKKKKNNPPSEERHSAFFPAGFLHEQETIKATLGSVNRRLLCA